MQDQLTSGAGRAADTIDMAELVRSLKRQWRAVLSFIALGTFGALAVIVFAPRRYDGIATVLAQTSGAGGGSLLGRMGTGAGGQLLNSLGGDLGGSLIETELQLLKSRSLAGQVIDSLALQVSVRAPAGRPARSLVAAYQLQPLFAPRTYTFTRGAADSWQVSGDSVAHTARAGQPVSLEVGTVTLAASGLPAQFGIKLLDRDDAITRFQDHTTVAKAGGEVARIIYRADDPITAAAATNALVYFYMDRKRTVDRGANQRRVEYVSGQLDGTEQQLAAAEHELRRYQEQTHVFEPEVFDKANLESAEMLRRSLVDLQVDEAGIGQLLAQADRGHLNSMELAAYPSFMKGSAVSPLVTQLSDLEVERTRMLERRTERDPEVMAIDSAMRQVSNSIVGMARSYATGVTRQRVEFQARFDSAESALRALPEADLHIGRLKRDVLRLTQLVTALQAQLVEARLGAIGEGGDVRPIDNATVPRNPSFPRPFLSLGLGIVGGLLAGLIAALMSAWFGRWLRDPADVERLTGVSAHQLRDGAPLLVSGTSSPQTVLVVPLDEHAQARLVAERLVRTASARALPVSVLDFTGNGAGNGAGGSQPHVEVDVARQIEELERQHGMVVVQLPTLSNDATLAALRDNRAVVLVAPPGPVDRARITAAVNTLRRLNIPCAGIVVSDDVGGRTAPRLVPRMV